MHSKPAPPRFSILIVDDEPKNIQLLGSILSEKGYDVEFATSGEEAVGWVHEGNFDLILLDIMMPGMDGYEVCRRIKATPDKSHIPVIFLTAKVESEDIVMGFDVGGSDYITKPFKAPELLARIKMQVEMKILRGLIPICSGCKSVRKDKDTWEAIELYLAKHSSALFSHGLCPKCMDDIYGQKEWYIDMKKKKAGETTNP